MSKIRAVGTAIFVWYQDTSEAAGTPATLNQPEPHEGVLPIVTADRLRSLLVPNYLPSIDLADGWGNPIEVRVNPRVLAGQPLLDEESGFVVISAGADGEFEDGPLTQGCYLLAQEPNSDIAWTDGYFVRRPTQDSEADCLTGSDSYTLR